MPVNHGKIKPAQLEGLLKNTMRFQFNRNTKLFLASTLLYGFSFSVWELFFNLYILSLGFNSDMLGLIRSATPLAALFLGLPLGLLSDRIGRRTSMIVGLIIGFIGMFFEIRLLSPWLIFLFGLIQGAGFMLYRVSQSPFIMAASVRENQAMIFSLNFGLAVAASTIGNLLAGQIPSLLERWLGLTQGTSAAYQWVITAGILFAATSLIPVFMIREVKIRDGSLADQIPLQKMLRKIINQPVARRLAFINMLIGLGAAILIPYLNVFLRTKFNVSDNLLGLIFSLSSLLVFLGTIISPWIVRITHSRIIPTVATQGASLMFLFALGFSPILWIAVVSLFLRNVLMQSSSPLLDNFSMLIIPPEEQGTIASLRMTSWQAGQTIGLFISGLVQTRFGFTPLFITTGLLYGLAAALTWFFFRPIEKEMRDVLPV